ncbi:hypothetical protein [Streptomyces sp. Z26]|uniref:hypothetical protein n=1 Tax=Streptomyces sp. Z26 TaxID=2500177 RepID=UPI000FCB8FC0|nr:hypothetical protein [Streptomyces sp. Z26]
MLTKATTPRHEKHKLLHHANYKDNQTAKLLRAEATKARSTSRGAEHCASGLQAELAFRSRSGPQPV